MAVLTCTESNSHWSDDLTLIHEAEAGNGNHPIDIASRTLAIQTVRTFVGKPAPVALEIGCSSGFFLRDIRQTLPHTAIIGADYIAGPLHRLASRSPGIPLIQFDLRACPLAANSVDAVVCLNVLEHIDQDEQALREIFRILKPGGIAHVEVPAAPSCYDIYDEFLLHHRRYSRCELKAKVRAAGFTIRRFTHLGAFAFPAFYLVKQRNRRLMALPAEQKAARVRQMMRTTHNSWMMSLLVRFELSLGRMIRYPLGIRCVTILQKPDHA